MIMESLVNEQDKNCEPRYMTRLRRRSDVGPRSSSDVDVVPKKSATRRQSVGVVDLQQKAKDDKRKSRRMSLGPLDVALLTENVDASTGQSSAVANGSESGIQIPNVEVERECSSSRADQKKARRRTLGPDDFPVPPLEILQSEFGMNNGEVSKEPTQEPQRDTGAQSSKRGRKRKSLESDGSKRKKKPVIHGPPIEEEKPPLVEKKPRLATIYEENEDAENNSSSDTVSCPSAPCLQTGRKFVGAHVSISGGIEKAVYEAHELGARSFALFLRPPQRWDAKPLPDENAQKFRDACKAYGYEPHLIIPHGPYLLNLGSPDKNTLEKSRIAFLDDLHRCKKLGLTMYNIHPGSSCGKTSQKTCIETIAKSINQALLETTGVKVVLENMCRQGSTIGGDFKELKEIIDLVEDKTRIGVCFDTCHAHAAGYDMGTAEGYERTMTEFEAIIGLKYLVAVHINDSKKGVGSKLDRHEDIGKGTIGKEGFRRLMLDPRFNDIPLVLETPSYTSYQTQIRVLNCLQVPKKSNEQN